MRKKTGSYNVLIVEDEPLIGMGIKKMLNRYGYNSIGPVFRGEEAVKTACLEKPDLVLMDIRLKGEMDGITAAEKIQEHIDLPVVYLTAHSDENTTERAVATAPYAYLLKPVKANELYTAIETVKQRTKVERRIKKSEKRYRSFVEDQTDLVCRFDKNGNITFANTAFKKFFGTQKKAFRGKTFGMFVPADERDSIMGDIMELKPGNDIVTREHFAEKHDGGRIWFHWTYRAIYGENGKLIEYHAEGRDINNKKYLEDRILELNSVLQNKIGRLESVKDDLETFNYSVSHDLKSPIANVKMFAGLILKKYDDLSDEKLLEYLKLVEKETKRMDEILDSLLKLSRIQYTELKLKPLKMLNIFRSCVKYTAETKEIHEAIFSIEEDIPPAMGEERLIKQVILNLLENAVKFAREDEELSVEISAVPDDEFVTFGVRDNGTGFAPESAEALFEPFRRFSPDRPGTGLGLNIVQTIIEKHGGAVWAEGEEGKGAAFYFRLPAVKEG